MRRHACPCGQMAEALVTGATGFLGRLLCSELIAWGAHVTALVRKAPAGAQRRLPEGVEVRVGDVGAPHGRSVPDGTDFVFHLAARTSPQESARDPVGAFEVNALSTARLLEEVRRRDIGLTRFVLASTSLVYAKVAGGRLTEQAPVQPATPYAASKAAAEAHALACDGLYGIPVTVVRVFNAYGPHQSPDFVIPSILRQCLAGGDVRLGNLWPVRDFVYGADVADLFWRAARSPRGRGEVFNGGTGKGTSIRALADACLAVTGSKAKVRVEAGRRRALETDLLVADPTKAERLLAWRAPTALKAGLRATADSMGGAWA